MLAPSIERAARTAGDFALASRAAFPQFVRAIEERSGTHVPLQRAGILEVALDAQQAAMLRAQLPAAGSWLDDAEVHRLEPSVAPTAGGVLWQEDGCVDNVILLDAIWRIVLGHPRISIREAAVQRIDESSDVLTVAAARGESFAADRVVLAAGAWAGQIRGAPCATSVVPMRGQIVVLGQPSVGRPVYCDDSYLVPRAGETLVGSTMEDVGFDPRTTDTAVGALRNAAASLCPPLADAPVERTWAGLRPVTPDMLPLIGPDPEMPRLIYACGHSRNGILMAPTTAAAVAQIVVEDNLTFDLRQFRPGRFRGTFSR